MTQLYKDPNAKRGTHSDSLLSLLTSMNGTLEAIQRSLDMYLETKRQFFPRFYFLSNDDLLEILGQSKNPEAVREGRGERREEGEGGGGRRERAEEDSEEILPPPPHCRSSLT